VRVVWNRFDREDQRRSAPMPGSRVGSHEEWGAEESKPFFRKILQRSWFIFIPLLGVWWFHVRDLTPQVNAVETRIEGDRFLADSARQAGLKHARKLGIQISRLDAFMDTLDVRTDQINSFMDSVRTLQRAHQEETALLESQIDSLRQVLSTAEGQSMEYSAALQMMQKQVDSLRTLIADHREEARRLEGEIQQAADLTDRILNPEKYRKNTALVAGEGDFPDRDALPRR
jgi:hypothetical protein